jgi:hypothetical protein
MVAATLAAVLLTGCAFDRLWNDGPAGREPIATPTPARTSSATPEELDERTTHPYTGELAEKATCVKANRSLLGDLENAGMVGGAVTYPVGVRVKANAKWWTIAVATLVSANDGGYTTKNVPRFEVFVSDAPSYDSEETDTALSTWKLTTTAGDEAAAKALACVEAMPVPKPKAAPKPWASYTGKLAAHATCVALTGAQLKRFQDVGQVGGAITYPRGFRVKANLKWWTVAVSTQVNPNGEGYTKDNVPATGLFVSSAPTSKASGVSFPIKSHKGDAAARKALACLG